MPNRRVRGSVVCSRTPRFTKRRPAQWVRTHVAIGATLVATIGLIQCQSEIDVGDAAVRTGIELHDDQSGSMGTLVVAAVDSGGPGWWAGLAPGDSILGLERSRTATTTAFWQLLQRKIDRQGRARILVKRDGNVIEVLLHLDSAATTPRLPEWFHRRCARLCPAVGDANHFEECGCVTAYVRTCNGCLLESAR